MKFSTQVINLNNYENSNSTQSICIKISIRYMYHYNGDNSNTHNEFHKHIILILKHGNSSLMVLPLRTITLHTYDKRACNIGMKIKLLKNLSDIKLVPKIIRIRKSHSLTLIRFSQFKYSLETPNNHPVNSHQTLSRKHLDIHIP